MKQVYRKGEIASILCALSASPTICTVWKEIGPVREPPSMEKRRLWLRLSSQLYYLTLSFSSLSLTLNAHSYFALDCTAHVLRDKLLSRAKSLLI